MKLSIYKHIFSILLVAATFFASCKKQAEDYGLRSVFSVYTTMTPTPIDAPTVSTSGAGAQSIADVSFRVYVNMLSEKAVTVSFSLTGTATKGTHYNYSGDNTVTIPANTRYVDVPIKIVNNSLGTTASRTIILTITGATENFNVGIGSNNGYVRSTYTMRRS